VQHPDLFLKHPDATFATYERRQIKHLRHASETLATYVYKKIDETLRINVCNIRVQPLLQYNIHMKQLKHTYENN
jgi:hypothetical protein